MKNIKFDFVDEFVFAPKDVQYAAKSIASARSSQLCQLPDKSALSTLMHTLLERSKQRTKVTKQNFGPVIVAR